MWKCHALACSAGLCPHITWNTAFTLGPYNINGPKQKAQAAVCSQKREVRRMELKRFAHHHAGSKAKTKPAARLLQAPRLQPRTQPAGAGLSTADLHRPLSDPKLPHLQATTSQASAGDPGQAMCEASPSLPCWLPTLSNWGPCSCPLQLGLFLF